jgi:hypothetical protein
LCLVCIWYPCPSLLFRVVHTHTRSCKSWFLLSKLALQRPMSRLFFSFRLIFLKR